MMAYRKPMALNTVLYCGEKIGMTGKERRSWQRVVSSICGNLAAGWYGIILIAPGFEVLSRLDALALTRSLLMGIVFMWLAYTFEKGSL